MLERLRNAIRPPSEEKPLPRKTTEVHLIEGRDPVERAATHEPALIMLEGDLPGQVFRLRSGRHEGAFSRTSRRPTPAGRPRCRP